MLNKNNKSGFTIVELLVVIVVIGILAAITIVSYSGISKKAIAASLQSDLDNNSKQLKLYNVEYGYYPASLDENNCPLTPTADTRYCLKRSTDTVLVYVGGGQTFSLTATKNSISYESTENSSPHNVVRTPITAMTAITGTPQIAQTLTAGAVTPADATVAYQWQSAATSGGTYTNISGATSNTIVINPSHTNKFLKVIVTGTGDYNNTLTSAATSSAVVVDTNWITVGTQTWAKANSNVGTMIAGATAQTNNSTLEKYCYGGIESNCTTYGGLYQWNEAMQYTNTESTRGICSAGSHVPSDAEWKTLEMSLSGMTQTIADTTGWRGTNEGTKLKSGGASGLNVLLSGIITAGSSSLLSSDGYLLSSSESAGSVWYRHFDTGNPKSYRDLTDKTFGLSIRCVAD